MENNSKEKIAPLGYCNFRNQRTKFGIKVDDRRRHVYVIGKTGVGKTTLLENMVLSDILNGHGVGIVDPHGEFAEKMLDFVQEEMIENVIYFNPADTDYPIAFNPMERVSAEYRHLIASGLMGVFKKIWPDVWSARMEYILNNTLLALLEFPGATVLGIMRMLSEPSYRKKVIENLQDPVIKAFWVNEFSRYSQRLESEAVAAIQNKVGQFVSNPLVRNIMGQPHSTLNMRKIMDEGKIFIANLSKGKIGEDNSALLGSMLITRLNLAAMSRVDMPEHERSDFFLYVDEFQNFATDSFANILSEARKYRLSLTLSHQYIGQLVHESNTRVRDAVFGNVGTIICFRVGAADAEFLEKEFMPEFVQQDLVNLAKANIYIKLMIDGVASRPFSAETIPPPKPPLVSYKDEIIKMSREKYGTARATVEKKIASEWQEEGGKLVEEKAVRRGERPPREMLGGSGQIVSRQPRFVERETNRQTNSGYSPRQHSFAGEFGRGDRHGWRPEQGRDGSSKPFIADGHRREEQFRRVEQPPIRNKQAKNDGAGYRGKPDVNVELLRRAIGESLAKSGSHAAVNRDEDKLLTAEIPESPAVEKPFYVTDEDAEESNVKTDTSEVSFEDLAEAEIEEAGQKDEE